MTSNAEPFTRVEPAPRSGVASIVVGWREADGSESVVLRLPLGSAIRSLFKDLRITPVLLPTGVIALSAEALPESEFAALLTEECVPEATLSSLVRAMLDEMVAVPDTSDKEDLGRLATSLETAARDVRAALGGLKSATGRL